MNSLTIRTPDKDHNVFCPSSWDEVTVKQFIGLEFWDGKDVLQLLSILTGLDYNIIANSNKDTANKIADIVSFIFDNPPNFNKLERKADIKINGKTIKMPTSLEMETYGQAILVQKIINDKDQDPKALISEITAIYVQKQLDGQFLEERIKEVKAIIDNMPILIIYPHCFFFFKKLLKYRKTGIIT